ncbi:MAG: tetratricopeptide repeat protein [Anaerolineae bacterium]|nr:tetratricopeptide repeat protein [Anaerolineae bacterium]
MASQTWNWILSRFYLSLADSHRYFGNRYANREEHWAAVRNYTRAVSRDPAYTRAYFSRGLLYWRELGEPERAVQDLTRVLELDPGWAEAYFNRAMAHRLILDFDQAAADLERYLEEGSDDFWLDSARRQLEDLRRKPATADPGEDTQE